MAKGIKTGGRSKGTPNKATVLNREFLQDLINKQTDKLEKELSQLNGKDFISVMLQFMEFIIPKIQRQQILISKDTMPQIIEPLIIEEYDEETDCSSFSITTKN